MRWLVALVLAGCQPAATPDRAPGPPAEEGDTATPSGDPTPIYAVLMIGDGMGFEHLDAASGYRHGTHGSLQMQALPHRGTVRTASPSGITDSAAAATVMASGVFTYNRYIGVDRDGEPVETLVELARSLGLGTGVVSTAILSHATPASFTAHVLDREWMDDIAEQQLALPADVMFGGGGDFFTGTAPGLQVYAPEHMDYDWERTDQPALVDLSIEALDRLESEHPEGFFLMIEGARIDMASHVNDLSNAVGDTLAFDDAIAGVRDWLAVRDGTLVVTADHECGGLSVDSDPEVGVLPEASWRWGVHTNADVPVFGVGPGTEVFDGRQVDHRTVHAVLRSRLVQQDFAEPGPVKMADGYLDDLRLLGSSQVHTTDFGEGFNQLDAVRFDADPDSLFVGFEGTFEWDTNAVVLLIDADYGAATGLPAMLGAVTDIQGFADQLLSGMQLTAPADPGFGADFALVAHGGQEVWLDALGPQGGLRSLSNPADLPWLGAVVNFGEGSRVPGAAPIPGVGLELAIPWHSLYGEVPESAQMAFAAVLVNDDGGYLSNQALPPFADPVGAARNPAPIPGLVVLTLENGAVELAN